MEEMTIVRNLQRQIDVSDRSFSEIAFSEIGLSMDVFNCFKKAMILTIRNIVERGIRKLSTIQGFNKNMYKLYSTGVLIK